MGFIANTGAIKANKPFTSEAKDAVINVIGVATFRLDELLFEDYYDRDFDETIEELVNELEPLGYELNGYITYYGDSDGAIEIHDNKVNRLTSEQVVIKEATDNDLISELKFRGYKVFKEM